MPNIDLTKCWINGAPPQAAPLQTDISEHGSLIAFQLHAVRFLESWLPLAPIIAQNKKAITYADKKDRCLRCRNNPALNRHQPCSWP